MILLQRMQPITQNAQPAHSTDEERTRLALGRAQAGGAGLAHFQLDVAGGQAADVARRDVGEGE